MKPSLLLAYQQAVYMVVTEFGEIPIKVNVRSQRLEELLIEFGSNSAIFITACNPQSVIATQQINRLNSLKLKSLIEQSKCRYLHGYSTDNSNQWPIEDSFLVFDLSTDKVRYIAKFFNQNAYLSISIGQPVELVCLSIKSTI